MRAFKYNIIITNAHAARNYNRFVITFSSRAAIFSFRAPPAQQRTDGNDNNNNDIHSHWRSDAAFLVDPTPHMQERVLYAKHISQHASIWEIKTARKIDV